jgi:hypothetical protein
VTRAPGVCGYRLAFPEFCGYTCGGYSVSSPGVCDYEWIFPLFCGYATVSLGLCGDIFPAVSG